MRKFLISILMSLVSATTYSQSLYQQPTDPNETCQQAWQDYKKADVLWKTGWGLFGTGAGMAIAGSVAWTITNYDWKSENGSTWTHPGFSIMCIGGGIFFGSIPCLIVGQVRRKAAMKIYEKYNCLPATCEEIKINYKKANTLWKTGWGLFGAGAGLAFSGCLTWRYTMQWGLPPLERNPRVEAASTAGFTIMIIGAGALVASIPCIAVGQKLRKAAQSVYNERCSSEPPITFAVHASSNGLGLAMRF